jgi:viroplasmin and RNaseH domain-containing protein
MARCYVVFYGKTPGIYLTWHEYNKQVLRIRNAIYKKYSNYEQAVRDFQAAMRDVNPPLRAAPPLLYNLVS